MSEKEAVFSGRPDISGLARRVARRILRRSSSDARDAEIIEQSGLFDRADYLRRYPDVVTSGMDPVRHYILHGASEGRDPSVDFSTAFYLRNNPDVAASGINPFIHFIEHGQGEGRACRPGNGDTAGATVLPGRVDASSGAIKTNSAKRTKADAEVIERSGTFDKAYYLATYPGTVPPGMDPVQHYLKYGAAKGKNPNALFDTEYYQAQNGDVAASGMNPLVHFCRYGFHELRNPSPGFDIAWYWVMYLTADLHTNPVAHYLARGLLDGSEIRAVGDLSDEDKERMVAACQRLMEEAANSNDQALYLRLGAVLTGLSRWKEAETAFRVILATEWKNAMIHGRLAMVLARQGKWWQAVESWEAATALDASRAKWFFHLGEAQEKMNRFALAADAYQRAIDLEPDQSKWYYLLGYMRERNAQRELADAAYAEAVARDPYDDVKVLGIGVFHQARDYWPEAAEAYAKELEREPASAELHYRLGRAHDRCYRWQDAGQAYRNAIALKPDTPYWHYRYGFVLERQQRYAEAAEAYAAGALLSPKIEPSWWYRRGYVLAAAGRFEEACLAYIRTQSGQTVSGEPYCPEVARQPGAASTVEVAPLQPGANAHTGEKGSGREWLGSYLRQFSTGAELISRAIERDWTDAAMHFRLGRAREFSEDWSGAAQAYADAVARSDEHCSEWYYRLGFVLFRAGRFEDACDAFRQTRIIQKAYGISEAGLSTVGFGVKLTTIYAEYLHTLPVNDKVILYESHIGKSVSCSPLGIFRKLLENRNFDSYLHVWVVDDPSRIPQNLRRLPNVIFAERLSDLYLRYLATAGYLINNTGFPPYFVRRKEQKYLATWHGTPLKTLGKQQIYKFLEHKRTQRNFLQATHIISPNPHTTGVLLDSYDIRHIMNGKLGETGYPRVDLTLNASAEERKDVLRQLGASGSRPVVLYAPTWRGTLETVAYDIERAKADLRRLAEHHDCDIVFRGHHLMEKVFSVDEPIGCTVVPGTIDTNVLLSVVDVLITDYSSIFFDFLPTGRPILYYVYDQETYEKERGLYFSMDEMPGYKCSDFESLDEALALALQGQVSDREHCAESRRLFNSHDDGKASERVIDFFFHDDPTHVVDQGPRPEVSILMHGGGFQRNGITTSLLNLVNAIHGAKVRVTVTVSPEGIESTPANRELFDRLPNDVPVVPRSGVPTMTWEERWLRKLYETRPETFEGERLELIRDLFDREYLRIFGYSHFDTAVAFSGYDAFWAAILTLNRRTLRKAIYMHSDMREEYVARFPSLIRMFSLYGFADALVSVCPESEECNLQHLSSWLDIPAERFVSCENMQDAERIIELSQSDIEQQDESLFGHGPVFINMGRLSVEKDHAKLIRAFSRAHERRPDAQLIILGSGPLQHGLVEMTARLNLSNCVHLLGYRINPYAYIRRSDCFVLSSNHEAKTMSLIETLIVGKPFVATDIPGNRDIRKGYPHYFFENSEQGLAEGMQRYLDGDLLPPAYDWQAHQGEALRQFEERVVAHLEGVDQSAKASTPA